MIRISIVSIALVLTAHAIHAAEYHVSPGGNDGSSGSEAEPLKTISAAAEIAHPGDVITVHEGIYRERVNPPRGGTSDDKRIVYRAAAGEKVVIKGSEIIKGWEKVRGGTWKVILPNARFDSLNPFDDLIRGDWYTSNGNKIHTGAVYLNGHWLDETFALGDVLGPSGENPRWFTQVGESNTTIWAQFGSLDPNREVVEINTRRAVFYPEKPGMNYITVSGFTMEHAATPWAPPTAEQIGLIGTHWSKGWIIEDNIVRYSVCAGITLGKHGDEFDNTSQNSAEGYVETINRALDRGWSKKNIGHHVVRNNRVSHCGQAGIVGSMGAAFSTVTGNEIHDIHLGRSFGGAEMAGIKFHGAIDTVIRNNHVYRCGGHGGIWLDWMTQGTRVSGNLLHDNSEDLFVEVNHGPFLVDNNLFLSPAGLLESCGGGAYVHNLFGCQIRLRAELDRKTPFHQPHSTKVLGLSKVVGDDERFHNNLFVGHRGLSVYDDKAVNLRAIGNVFLAGSEPSPHDRDALVIGDFDPGIRLQQKPDGWWLEMALDPAWTLAEQRAVATTDALGTAMVSGAKYVQPDGSAYRIDTDYFGTERDGENPAPGPFQYSGKQTLRLKVWPITNDVEEVGLPEITADEPIAERFSAKRAAQYLDRSALNWQKTKKCATCHTNLFYMAARPALKPILPDSGEVRRFYEDYPKVRWAKKRPRESQGFWPIVVGAGLTFNDAQTTGTLSEVAREVLDVMWTVQREDGGWRWPDCDYAPLEIDDHYGVTIATLTVGIAPDGYADSPQARAGLQRIREYLKANPPKSLHHRAMLAWCSVRVDGIASESQRSDTLAELLALQLEDGGWSTSGLLSDWKRTRDDGEPLETETSDGYGTGFVMVVARELGLSADDARLRRGVDWLHANQRESGKWFTRSPVKDCGNLITNCGSAYAILALQACGELPGGLFGQPKPASSTR